MLLFDQEERGPDDEWRLQFEAARSVTPEEGNRSPKRCWRASHNPVSVKGGEDHSKQRRRSNRWLAQQRAARQHPDRQQKGNDADAGHRHE